MVEFTDLELKVMQMLLEGDDEVLACLRRQLEVCKVSRRETTGVGFFTHLALSLAVPSVADGKSFKFGDVSAALPQLGHGAGFLLYIKHGVLHMLEGYSYDEPWPDEIETFQLSYDKVNRDLPTLRKIWS